MLEPDAAFVNRRVNRRVIDSRLREAYLGGSTPCAFSRRAMNRSHKKVP